MKLLLTGGWIYTPAGFKQGDIAIVDGKVFAFGECNLIGGVFDKLQGGANNIVDSVGGNIVGGNISEDLKIKNIEFERVIDCDNSFVLPGFCDVHVHLREPGFEYKETIASGSMAGAHGGYTCICTMPNLNPAPEDMESLQKQLDIIGRDAVIEVIPYGRITNDGECGRSLATASPLATPTDTSPLTSLTHTSLLLKDARLSDMDAMADSVVAFSDDGMGVADADVMEAAMRKAVSLGKIIVAHCEDMKYPPEDSRSEWKQVERDLALCEKTGCKYHVCHVSTKESIELIRQAKKQGLDVTCETAPHYLMLNNEIICNMICGSGNEAMNDVGKGCNSNCEGGGWQSVNSSNGGKFKMNPPIRSEEDRLALIEGLRDGTIDMIATDHAPHSMQEKSGGFARILNGIVGLETAFPVMYTQLVDKGVITLERLVELMAINPRKRFGLAERRVQNIAGHVWSDVDRHKVSGLYESYGITIVDAREEYSIDPNEFLSKGRSTPFEGMRVKGRVLMTIAGDHVAWENR